MHSETESEQSEEIYTGGQRVDFHSHPKNTPSQSDQSMASELEDDDGSSYKEETFGTKKKGKIAQEQNKNRKTEERAPQKKQSPTKQQSNQR